MKIGIIGCGKQAPKHISGLRTVPGVELVLADASTEAAQRLSTSTGIPWLPVEDVLADSAVTAVDICTPTPSHADLIRSAVEAGKDFLCEKPLTENLEEAREIARLVEVADRIGMVGFIYRFAPAFRKGHGILDSVPETGSSPVLGRIVASTMRIGGRGSHQLWKHRRATGGGAVSEMLVHMIDLALWYFGPVRRTEVLSRELLRPRRRIGGREEEVDAEDYVLVRLETESGVCVLCQGDLVTPAFTQYIEVQGDNGTLMASIQPDMPSFVYCEEEAAGWKAGRTALGGDTVNLFEAQMGEFVRAVERHVPPTSSTVTDAVRVMEVLEMLGSEPKPNFSE